MKEIRYKPHLNSLLEVYIYNCTRTVHEKSFVYKIIKKILR